MLELKNISKSFPGRGTVLDKLSLEIKAGETLAIAGPSGSGKTTLLNIIGLLDNPDNGNIHFNNDDISDYGTEEAAAFRRDNIGFVFQEHHLLAHLTISENIFLPLLAGKKSNDEVIETEKRVDYLLKKTGIESIREKFPWQVSGGEAQRATLVRALVNNPSLLLADEPTGSLDARNSDELADLLLELNRDTGITVIAVTHSSKLAGKLGRTLYLEEGSLKPGL
jgi:lipoprotein-releasing system ATP-binding protein